jgi:uncharacterized protein YecE (DUF72 family)
MAIPKTPNPNGRTRVGVGGWTFEPWRGAFYPADLPKTRELGANKTHKLGYAPDALDVWAGRARTWAAGGSPADLPLIASAPNSKSPRDVFLYAISGFKERNPAAALALIERLSPSKATR